MHIRKYNKKEDEIHLMSMIKAEEGWDYADEHMANTYQKSLETSITFVAYQDQVLCGYSRSILDCGTYIYVCDLLVMPVHRGKEIGRKLMECLHEHYPQKTIYVMSDEDGYYEKLGYKRAGSIFEVPEKGDAKKE